MKRPIIISIMSGWLFIGALYSLGYLILMVGALLFLTPSSGTPISSEHLTVLIPSMMTIAIFGTAALIMAIGLWKLRAWARTWTVGILVLQIVVYIVYFFIPALSAYTSALQFLVSCFTTIVYCIVLNRPNIRAVFQ